MKRKTMIFAAVAYAALMLWLLLGRSIFADRGAAQFEMSYNFIPFKTIRHFIKLMISSGSLSGILYAVVNLGGNVIMFLPMGFFLPGLWKKLRSLPGVILSAAAIIMAVELTQLFTLRGTCDIDDLILNILGAVMGYGIFILAQQSGL